ncbi:MAG: histidine phosphatase family protein [Spirochaetes bacterium]|nr:MAG: histidine phosphatase family protein [Spirochaetota bacterium]
MNFRNRYMVMRHGESEANVAHIIASGPDLARGSYGLTGQGAEQVRGRVRECGDLDRVTIVCSSDYRRAIETAEIVREILGLGQVRVSALLRERFFGEFEGRSSEHYYDVWAGDAGNPDNGAHGVETPRAVRARMLAFVEECEKDLDGETLLIVSHGDPLQILCAAFRGLAPDRHREIPPMGNADVRMLEPAEGFALRA